MLDMLGFVSLIRMRHRDIVVGKPIVERFLLISALFFRLRLRAHTEM